MADIGASAPCALRPALAATPSTQTTTTRPPLAASASAAPACPYLRFPRDAGLVASPGFHAQTPENFDRMGLGDMAAKAPRLSVSLSRLHTPSAAMSGIPPSPRAADRDTAGVPRQGSGCAREVIRSSPMPDTSPPIPVNRAPVLTLWATVVAERLGYTPDTALTFGRFVAGSSARAKARRLGIMDEAQEAAERNAAAAVRFPPPRSRSGDARRRRVPAGQCRAG